MKLEPMGKRLIAKQFEDDKIGELYVPDTVKKVSLRATVVAVGPDVIWVEVGDKILFGRYAKFDIPLRGDEFKDHFIMNEVDLLAKIVD